MKLRYKFLAIILIITLAASTSVGCRRRSDGEDPQQPAVGDRPVVAEKEEDKEVEEQPPTQDKEQQPSEKPDKDEAVIEDSKGIVTLENEKEEEITIEQTEDKLLVMTFWVDWNQQAKDQLKILENLYPLLQDDVDFVGIHALGFDSISKAEAQEKIKAEGYSYPMLIDEESKAQQKYFVGSFPTTVIIDKEGNVVKSLTTVVEEDELLKEIETILE